MAAPVTGGHKYGPRRPLIFGTAGETLRGGEAAIQVRHKSSENDTEQKRGARVGPPFGTGLVMAELGFHAQPKACRVLFGLRGEFVAAIVKSLNVHLDFQSHRPNPPQNMAAYDVTLMGIQFLKQWKPAQAIELFEKAVRLSPDYALAYALLAGSYDQLGGTGQISMPEAMVLERRYNTQALKLDPHLRYALLLEANIHYWFDVDSRT